MTAAILQTQNQVCKKADSGPEERYNEPHGFSCGDRAPDAETGALIGISKTPATM